MEGRNYKKKEGKEKINNRRLKIERNEGWNEEQEYWEERKEKE